MTSTPFKKKFRITLWGVDKEPIALSRPLRKRDGLFLREVPPELTGHGREHMWDEASGAWRGISRGTNQFTLELEARGPSPRTYVDGLLRALGDGTEPVALVVTSAEWGYRWHHVRVKDVSNIQWHTSPGGSPLAIFSLILEFAGRPSRRFTEKLVLDRTATFGEIPLRVDGDQGMWPRFIVKGRHAGVKVRLTASDEWQELPYRPGGWIVDSHPEHRLVTDLNGVPDFSTVVPFWPEPVKVRQNRGSVWIQATNPGADFSLTVEFVPEMSRTW